MTCLLYGFRGWCQINLKPAGRIRRQSGASHPNNSATGQHETGRDSYGDGASGGRTVNRRVSETRLPPLGSAASAQTTCSPTCMGHMIR